MELTVDRIPLLVTGLSCTVILNLNESDSMYHRTLSALSIGSVSLLKLKPTALTSLALSFSGRNAKNSLLLLIHLVKLNPPEAHSALKSLYK